MSDFSKPFIIEIDASGLGIGVVLMQRGHPLAFIRTSMSPKHAAMSIYDKELLALVYAISK